jgi:hypothetical protein
MNVVLRSICFLSSFCFLILLIFLAPGQAQAQDQTAQAETQKQNQTVPMSKQKIWSQQAQAIVESTIVYSQADFDSEVLRTIEPGTYYWISAKPEGPFYKILLAPNKYGYVPDTELDIKGRGPFQPKKFTLDETDETQSKKSAKKKSSEDDDEASEDDGALSHLLSMNLVNYHEDTLGGVQVGDLWALKYQNLGWGAAESDYGLGGLSWDVMAATSAPSYYQKKTGLPAKGFIFWGGLQFQNYSSITVYNQLRYGLGGFFKYSNFEVETSLKKYSLQDVTVGVSLEAALQFVFTSFGIDLGLQYYWDKNSYGVLSVGVLF